MPHFLLALLISPTIFADELLYVADKQYIFSDHVEDDFSFRTLSTPSHELQPHPAQLTNSAFENIFYSNTSIQARSQGSPTISIRGSNQAARTSFVLDEVPLNFADGFGGSSLLIPIELTKKIQIIEGPASALYGANAMSGVLHFKTLGYAKKYLSIGMGDSDKTIGSPLTTANVALILPWQINPSNALRGSVFLENDRGDFYHSTQGSDDQRQNNSQNLRRLTLSSKHQFEKWHLQSFALYTGLNKNTPGPLQTPLNTTQTTDATLASLHAKHSDDETVYQSTLAVSRLRSRYFDGTSNHSISEKVFANQTFAKKFYSNMLSQTLLDINWNRYQSSYTGNETFDRVEPELAQTFYLAINPRLTVEPSVRYLTKYQKWISQIHMPYKYNNATIWWSGSQGFRPPSLTDLYARTPYFIGNTHLLPETSLQMEVGMAWTTDVLSSSATVFKSDATNLFQSYTISPSTTSKMNVGKSRTTGVEIALEIKSPLHWRTHLKHTLLSATDISNHLPILGVSQNQSFFSISREQKNWSMTLQHTLASGFYDIDFNSGNRVRLNPWDSTDVLISVHVKNEHLLSLGVFNIFDNPKQLSFDFPEPQRRIFANLMMQF